MTISVDQQGVRFEVPRPLIVASYPAYAVFVTDDVSGPEKVVSQVNISFENKTIYDQNAEDGFIHKPILVVKVYDEHGKEVSKTEVPLDELSEESQRKRKEILSIRENNE